MIDEPTEQDLPEQIRVRMDKRAKIIANGGEALFIRSDVRFTLRC